MATSQWGTVVQALATAAAANTGWRLKGDTGSGDTVTVYRGAEGVTSSDPGDYVRIGYAGDDQDGGSWSQTAGPLAATAGRPRNETGTIVCQASAQTGNPAPLDALTAAEAIVAGVESVLRSNPTLGLVPPLQRLVAEMGGASSMRWRTGKRGPICDITFTVTYTARI